MSYPSLSPSLLSATQIQFSLHKLYSNKCLSWKLNILSHNTMNYINKADCTLSTYALSQFSQKDSKLLEANDAVWKEVAVTPYNHKASLLECSGQCMCKILNRSCVLFLYHINTDRAAGGVMQWRSSDSATRWQKEVNSVFLTWGWYTGPVQGECSAGHCLTGPVLTDEPTSLDD